MVRLEIGVLASPSKQRELLAIMEEFATKDCREMQGCLGRRLFDAHGSPHRFLWIEDWESQEALDRYQGSNQFRALRGAIDLLGTVEEFHVVIPAGDELPGALS